MPDLKTNILHSKKLRSALMVLALFSGSVLGGMLFAYITKPKEACAQCVALPTKSSAVYQCPTPQGSCSPISGSTCVGSLSLNSTCIFKDSCSGRSGFRTYNCPFAGYIVL